MPKKKKMARRERCNILEKVTFESPLHPSKFDNLGSFPSKIDANNTLRNRDFRAF